MGKILIIEDNNEIRENTAEILALEGYQVSTAANGKKGIEKALADRPDLIFCDIMMPDLDGYAVLYLLIKNNETMNIPFIFLTARTEKSDIQKGLGLGATNYLVKPFTDSELLDAARAAIKKSSSKQPVKCCTEQELTDFIAYAVSNFHTKISATGIMRKNLMKGEMLFSEKSKPTAIYFIISGKIRSYLLGELGNGFITNMHGTGEFLGFTAVLEGTEHKDNAMADEDTVLLSISSDNFFRLIHHSHSLAKHFIKLLAGGNAHKEDKLASLVYYSFRKRIIDSLLVVHGINKKGKNEYELSDIFQDRADFGIYASNEYMNDILNDLKAANLIDIQQEKIIITEERQLKRLVNLTP